MVDSSKTQFTKNKGDKFIKAAPVQRKPADLERLQHRAVKRVLFGEDATQKDSNYLKLKNIVQNAKSRVDSYWKTRPSTKNTNRGRTGSADATQKDSNDIKLKNIVQNAKPRVDSNWKTRPSTKHTNRGRTETVALLDQSHKIVNRSHSLPSKLSNTPVIGNALRRHRSNSQMVGQNKVDTEEKLKKTGERLEMRREDGNPSPRKSSKLTAAMSSIRNKISDSKISSATLVTVEAAVSKSGAVKKEVGSYIKQTKEKEELQTPNIPTDSSKALNLVEDIDAGDSDKLFLVPEYVNDIYDYFFQLESAQSLRENHLDSQAEIKPKMRAAVIDALYKIHCHYELEIETMQMTVAIIDRYLQAVTNTKLSQLQLVCLTAFLLAIKYEEIDGTIIEEVISITKHRYSTEQLMEMEFEIFKTLDFNLPSPLPIHFLRRFLKAAKIEDNTQQAMAEYILEISAIEYVLAPYKPSEIAAASLFLTLHLLTDDAEKPSGLSNAHWTPTLEWYSRYNAKHLRPIVHKIAAVVQNAGNAALKTVYRKYSDPTFHQVALRAEFYDEVLDSIILLPSGEHFERAAKFA